MATVTACPDIPPNLKSGILAFLATVPARPSALTPSQASTPGLTDAYRDMQNDGLRITDDGLLWFDGLTDDLSPDNVIYCGTGGALRELLR